VPKRQKPSHTNEWSHYYNADRVEGASTRLTIEADEQSRKNVSVRANVISIDMLNADLTLEREQAGRVVHVAGRFTAAVNLECVVTAEEFILDIEEPVEGWFEDKESTVSFMKALKDRDLKGSQSGKGPVEVEMASEEEDPEAMIDGQIDLGELVVQHLILAIPPCPKKEGARHDYTDEEIKPAEDSPLKKNPFEALKDWKERR